MTKVLIVDDDKMTRFAISEIIKMEGFYVEEAENGRDGLNMIKKNEYDLILCDIQMPGMNGIEMVEKVKELKSCSPVVIISSHHEMEMVEKALKSGAFDFVSKPIDMTRFIVTLQNALNHYHLSTEIKSLKDRIKKINEIKDATAPLEKIKRILNN